MLTRPIAHQVSLTSLLNRRAELFDAARPTAVSVDKGARQVMAQKMARIRVYTWQSYVYTRQE